LFLQPGALLFNVRVCIALESRVANGFCSGKKASRGVLSRGLIDVFYRLVVKLWVTWCSVFCFLALISIWYADGWPDS
jgi:hypothetical protein